MKELILFGLLLVISAVVAQTATECNRETCRLPECRCSSIDIPGNLDPRDTPQFVLLTFDDSINTVNIETYRRLLYNRFNSNNCPAGVTFYVSHEYTSYEGVNELYARGFEIALHSITHRTPQTFWRDATEAELEQEFANQKRQMAHFANIPIGQIRGLRMPFIQMAGNNQFRMMAKNGFVYDASWPTNRFTEPGLWPYTLHHQSIQDCNVAPPCPTESIPGPWVVPMVSWTDRQGFPCSFADACIFPPDLEDEDAWYDFILENFERHYKSNKAPFGVYLHEGFVRVNPAVQRALSRFLTLINNLHDTFMVTTNEVIEYVKNPVPLNEYRSRSCRFFQGTMCRANTCPLQGRHTPETFFLRICNVCPRVYPWVDNPLGV